jgi:serine/threonine protein kinase
MIWGIRIERWVPKDKLKHDASQRPPVTDLILPNADPEDHDRRFVGTPDYLAPETINGVGQDEISDWWSLKSTPLARQAN